VAHLTTIADYFLICSAESQPQVKAIMEHINATLARSGETPFSQEGEAALRWLLIDYSDLIVHVFREEVRAFYALEHLWGDAPRLKFSGPAPEREKHRPSKRTKGIKDLRR
jgi:ribosome-associated protein